MGVVQSRIDGCGGQLSSGSFDSLLAPYVQKENTVSQNLFVFDFIYPQPTPRSDDHNQTGLSLKFQLHNFRLKFESSRELGLISKEIQRRVSFKKDTQEKQQLMMKTGQVLRKSGVSPRASVAKETRWTKVGSIRRSGVYFCEEVKEAEVTKTEQSVESEVPQEEASLATESLNKTEVFEEGRVPENTTSTSDVSDNLTTASEQVREDSSTEVWMRRLTEETAARKRKENEETKVVLIIITIKDGNQHVSIYQ